MIKMDRVSFEIGERFDYLQRTFSSHLQEGIHQAKTLFENVSHQTNTVLSHFPHLATNGIPFNTWMQWQWQWLMENCASICQSVQEFLNIHCQKLEEILHTAHIFFQHHFSQSHMVLFLGGLTVGLAIGLQFRQTPKQLVRMRALVCNSYNNVESIAMAEDVIAPTSCGSNEILIQVKASSIDPIDLKICQGYGRVIRTQYLNYHKTHSTQSLFPFVLGRECSGRVIEVGSKVQDLEVGDEVYAAVPYYACGVASETALLLADWVAKKPKGLSHEAAASLPFSGTVAWNALVLQASLHDGNTRGKRFLVHSADNPVGCFAIQLIKAWGGHVTATVCTRAMLTAQRLGADDVIVHDGLQVDFQVLLENRPKFHIVLNTMGSFLHDSCRSLCEEGGMIISTSTAPPASDKYGLILGSFYSQWLRIKLAFTGSIYGSMTISKDVLNEITDLVNRGKIQPVIERVFEIEQAEQAKQYAARGNTIGKIIVRFK